jgi:hypothetical protein
VGGDLRFIDREHDVREPRGVAVGVRYRRDRAHVRLERLQQLLRCREDHVESELAEHLHRVARVSAVSLVERLIEHDRPEPRNLVLFFSQLVPQRCREAEDDELLPLTTRQALCGVIHPHNAAGDVLLPREEAHVKPRVEHSVAPVDVDAVLGSESTDYALQHGESLLGTGGRLVGPVAFHDAAEVGEELVDLRGPRRLHIDLEEAVRTLERGPPRDALTGRIRSRMRPGRRGGR